MTVLIADDNDASCKLLRAILEADGHAVLVAADGHEALEILKGHPIDAIISDLLMPNLDGFRLCREIRWDHRWDEIPFICYTAIYRSQNDEKLALDLGADAYLRKPSSRSTILGTLRASVDRARARTEPPRRKAAHAELDILREYSQPLVDELANKNFELSEKGRLAELTGAVGVALTRRHGLNQMLQSCAESMVKHLDAALARIWTLKERNSIALELRASAAPEIIPQGVELGLAIVGRVAIERTPFRSHAIASELGAREHDWARREGVAAFVGYPLIVEERLVGVMAVFARKQLPEATIRTLAATADSLALGIQSKWAEMDLRESEERFRQLAENISEVFWMTDLAKKEVLYISPAYQTIWGRTCQSLMEQPQTFFEAIHPDDRARVLPTLRAQAAVPYDLEYRIVRPDFSVRWIRDRAFLVRDTAGLVIRLAGVAEDITEKRTFEMQLHQSQKMQAIGRLAGGVAHDFNNLLSIIFGHSELLAASSPSPERLRTSLAEINNAAERGAALTRQLLAFGSRQVVEPRVLELGAVLAESKSLLHRLIGEDVRLAMIISPGLRRVNVDPGQINQILVNLALNSRDSMPQGGELLIEARNEEVHAASASIRPEESPGRYVLLAFTDTGCGMTPEVQAQIFEPFFSTKSSSTGIGLSVVDGIVKQCGGHLTVASRPGIGTTFSIYIPAVEGSAEGLGFKSSSKPVKGHETILLVEDEAPVREVTALLLESLGYQVVNASNAEEALNFVNNTGTKVDLLLTDVVMPGLSGRELAEAIRGRDPGIKVLFQSGHTDDVVVRYGVLHDEVAFLQKPFTIHALAQKIRDLLDG